MKEKVFLFDKAAVKRITAALKRADRMRKGSGNRRQIPILGR